MGYFNALRTRAIIIHPTAGMEEPSNATGKVSLYACEKV